MSSQPTALRVKHAKTFRWLFIGLVVILIALSAYYDFRYPDLRNSPNFINQRQHINVSAEFREVPLDITVAPTHWLRQYLITTPVTITDSPAATSVIFTPLLRWQSPALDTDAVIELKFGVHAPRRRFTLPVRVINSGKQFMLTLEHRRDTLPEPQIGLPISDTPIIIPRAEP